MGGKVLFFRLYFLFLFLLPETNVSSLVLPTRTRKRTFLPLGYGFYPLKGKQNRRRKKTPRNRWWWWWRRWRSKPHGQQFFLDRFACSFFFFFSSSSSLLWNRFPFLSLFIFFFFFYWVNFTVVDRLMALAHLVVSTKPSGIFFFSSRGTLRFSQQQRRVVARQSSEFLFWGVQPSTLLHL